MVVAALRQALAPGLPRAARPRRRHDVVAPGGPGRRPGRAVVRAGEPTGTRRTAAARTRRSPRGGASRSSTSASSRRSRFAQSLALAAVLVAGGYLERHGRVTVGTIVAFALYLISLFDPIARLGDWFSEFQSGRAALTKIATLLEEPVTVPAARARCPSAGELAVENVDVRLRRRRAGGRRRLAEDRAGRASRARRRHRRGQVDARQAARARLRPERGPGHVRRRRSARRDARRTAAPHRLRASGGPPLLGDDRRQRPARRARRRLGRRDARRAARDRRARPVRSAARRSRDRRPVARRAPVVAASGSSSRSRGSRSPIRR